MSYALSSSDVEAIKQGREEGKTFFQLGEEFGISFQHAQAVCSGKRKALSASNSLPGEKWKLVPSFPILEASNLGRVRRVETQRVLSCGLVKKTGYLQVGFSYQSKKVNRPAHRLVAEAWLGICPEGLQVNHKNGNKIDNNISNLEYVTSSRNNKHAYETGLREAKGEKNGRSKLTKEKVLEIRRLATFGEHYEKIAQKFQISKQHAHAIICRKFWKHV